MVELRKVIVAPRRATQLLLRCTFCIVLGAAMAGCPQGSNPGPTGTTAATPTTNPGTTGFVEPGTIPGSNPGSTNRGGYEPDPIPDTVVQPIGAEAHAEVTAVNLGGEALQQVPVTFGEPFRAGDIPTGNTIVAYMDGTPLQTQANIKARNPDGSVRHAIVTVLLPSLAGGASERLRLQPVADTGANGATLTLDDLLQSGFDASIDINIAGQLWHLDARDLLLHASLTRSCESFGRECSQWLSGPLASEWIVGGPVVDSGGTPHPHLAVYFAVRAYGPAPVKRVRVDVIVENDWAYAPDPRNVTYNAKVSIGGQVAYTINDLEHYLQARWHKAFLWGRPDPVYAQQDSLYLQASLAVPRYEDISISQDTLQKAMERVQQECGPMQPCDQTPNMATAGAQAAIGPLPHWTSAYVIHPSYYAYTWMLANSDALGSYGVHFRDQATGQPVSVDDHPCMTVIKGARMSRCPVAPHANDNFPDCTSQCDSPLRPNEAHHPSPAYVAYLVTGDWYYLTELEFWADWVVFRQNPSYRDYRTGLVTRDSTRAQAWALRTLGYAAYGLPDDDPLKQYLNTVVANNIAWYNQNFTDNPSANTLHIITNGAPVYPIDGVPDTGIATWQASFLTWSIGNLRDLGFSGADRLLNWVGEFQVGLMTSPDFCWTLASSYKLQVRDTRDSPFYDSLAQVYSNRFPEMEGVTCNSDEMVAILNQRSEYQYARNVMVAHPESPVGFPANFQIGLAAATASDIPNAQKAWTIFENRSRKPDYSSAPQFAVVPRYTADSSAATNTNTAALGARQLSRTADPVGGPPVRMRPRQAWVIR